ncbi:MAG: hypothetical protein A4E55_02169 [Pelotomaculum sp. PtaU1.Bin035]|nr:MAG: hypothetical protein A4E55_02169 [Pelotomaculum sp. PtaU1.Bin035]
MFLLSIKRGTVHVFPAPEGIITSEEAEKIFLESVSLKPVYFFPWEEKGMKPGNSPVLSLAFDDNGDAVIDARTGQLVKLGLRAVLQDNQAGSVVPPEHWAASSLAILASSGLLPAEDFDPDGPVSRRDAVRVLLSASDSYYYPHEQDGIKIDFSDIAPDDPDYAMVQSAVRMGVLVDSGHFYPEQPVTREDLAVWLVRALGYNDVADMPVKIELKAADAGLVSEQAFNYVAIACGLGLISVDENDMLRPADQATWAELASLVVKATPRLRAVAR